MTADPLLDPRSYDYVNARMAAEQAERDLFAEIELKPAPGSTLTGMLRRALEGTAGDIPTTSERKESR